MESHLVEDDGDGPCSAEPRPPHTLADCSEPHHLELHREHGYAPSEWMPLVLILTLNSVNLSAAAHPRSCNYRPTITRGAGWFNVTSRIASSSCLWCYVVSVWMCSRRLTKWTRSFETSVLSSAEWSRLKSYIAMKYRNRDTVNEVWSSASWQSARRCSDAPWFKIAAKSALSWTKIWPQNGI